ncbi:hypothetical protein [Sphaerisporangium aureirubrum]|uniref:Uncharacterized protein n=1 Tax=Sphaerisporangium aureirubrum TaxID=1544736 RepID=A0ABW1NNE9_9ACTN
MRIGLLGTPGSGKLTFLSALPIADYGNWVVRPDAATVDFVTSAAKTLTEDKRFPVRDPVRGSRSPLGFGFSRGVRPDFRADVVNRPGEHFRHDREDRETIAKDLASCDGYVLLFDPIGERWRGDGYGFVSALAQRVNAHCPDGEFPKPLSVCCVKYDDPQVFLPALGHGWGTEQDAEPRFPRVADAEGFFAWACGHFGGGKGERFRAEILKQFDPRRTAYFVTSSIGFKSDRRRFDLDDFVNAQGSRILGEVHPINVVEPFVELARMIRGAS